MPTGLSTKELRELGAEVLARSVFAARATSAVFASRLKEVVEEAAGERMSEGQARTAMYEVLDALGYDVERGGFPGEELEPGIKGSIQDLRSFRRMDLIIRTQLQLMQGAGQQWRGQQPDMLEAFPAWELVRIEERVVPRDWESRWKIAGGFVVKQRMIALKGDPVWGEIGSYENFDDALGVDHPPFAFLSGMGWRAVSGAEVDAMGVTGPDGETPEEFFAGNPQTITGPLPKLPKPRLSLSDVDAELGRKFLEETHATPVPGKPGLVDFSDLLTKEIAAHDKKYYGEGGGA